MAGVMMFTQAQVEWLRSQSACFREVAEADLAMCRTTTDFILTLQLSRKARECLEYADGIDRTIAHILDTFKDIER